MGTGIAKPAPVEWFIEPQQVKCLPFAFLPVLQQLCSAGLAAAVIHQHNLADHTLGLAPLSQFLQALEAGAQKIRAIAAWNYYRYLLSWQRCVKLIF